MMSILLILWINLKDLENAFMELGINWVVAGTQVKIFMFINSVSNVTVIYSYLEN